jgi:hypothetical protein
MCTQLSVCTANQPLRRRRRHCIASSSCEEVVLDRRAGGVDPWPGVEEGFDRELGGFVLADHLLEPWPVDAAGHVGAGPRVGVLSVPERLEPEVAAPGHVPGLVDEVRDLRLHDEDSGRLAPRPAEVVADGRARGVPERGLGLELALLEHEARDLARFGAALRGGDVLLVVHGAAEHEDAVLEDGRRVAEDEVDGAGDDAVAVELRLGVRVQSVLERVHAAVEEDGPVRLHQQRHGLVLLRPGRVLESHPDRHEPVALRG